jgi:hypothetical protein
VTDLAPFPDAEQAVCDLLADLVTVTYPGQRSLATIRAGQLPALRAVRTGGTDDEFTDSPVVAVAVFTDDPGSAKTIMEAVRQRAVSLRTAAAAGSGVFDGAVTVTGPLLVTPQDATVTQCATASFRFSMRRPAR